MAVSYDDPKPALTLKEFCERMGWGYPLPEPETPEAEGWIDERVGKIKSLKS